MNVDADSLERIVPERIRAADTTGAATLELHLERYRFAAGFVATGRVLDMACGVGYGTQLLAERAPQVESVTGVDLDASAIEYAQGRYGGAGARFLVADAMAFRDDRRFDTIVSLETIEHLPDPRGFVAHLVTLLRPGGVLVASVPSTPSVDANPHHLHDFREASFRRLFTPHGLREIDALRQVQRFNPVPLLSREEARSRDLRRNLPLYYLRHPGSLWRRVWTTLRHGFANHYITIAWRASA